MGGFVITTCQVSARGFISALVIFTLHDQMTSCGCHLMACVMHKVAVVTHSRSSARLGFLKPKLGLVLGLSPWFRSGFEYPCDEYLDPVFHLLLPQAPPPAELFLQGLKGAATTPEARGHWLCYQVQVFFCLFVCVF